MVSTPHPPPPVCLQAHVSQSLKYQFVLIYYAQPVSSKSNDPKMILSITGQRCPIYNDICVTALPKSQISLGFTLDN